LEEGCRSDSPELEILKNLWGLGIKYRNKVIVPARQARWAGGIHSLDSILGLHERLKIRALGFTTWRSWFLGIDSWAPLNV
jgi:hypothetical protein